MFWHFRGSSIVLGPWRSLLRDSFPPKSGDVARAAMWCLYMSCTMICDM